LGRLFHFSNRPLAYDSIGRVAIWNIVENASGRVCGEALRKATYSPRPLTIRIQDKWETDLPAIDARIHILRKRILHGPNPWSRLPVVRLVVDIGALEQLPSNLIPGFASRLLATLPGLALHTCGTGEAAGLLIEAASHDDHGAPSRAGQPTFVPNEADATRAAFAASDPGDLVVLCVASGARVLTGIRGGVQ